MSSVVSSEVGVARDGYYSDRRAARIAKLIAVIGLFALAFWSVDYLRIPIERFAEMFGRVGAWVAARLFPPDMEYAVTDQIVFSVFETIEMSLLGATFGTLISIPVAWLAPGTSPPTVASSIRSDEACSSSPVPSRSSSGACCSSRSWVSVPSPAPSR